MKIRQVVESTCW